MKKETLTKQVSLRTLQAPVASAPANADKPSEEAASSIVQPAVPVQGEPKDFSQEECEKELRACREGDLRQGLWLERLRKYFEREKEWADHLQRTFGISQPYAAKRIRAWTAREGTQDVLKDKLPQTVDFWAAVHDIDEARRAEVLEMLVKDGICPMRLKAKDVRETDAWKEAHEGKRRKPRKSIAEAEAASMLNSLLDHIQNGDDILDELNKLSSDQQSDLMAKVEEAYQRHSEALTNLDKARTVLGTNATPSHEAA